MNKEKIQILLAIGFRYCVEVTPKKFRYFKTMDEAQGYTANRTWSPILKIGENFLNTIT